MTLAGKTALVTGGGTGIGAAVALALAREGCRVMIAGRRADKLADVAKQHAGPTPILTCVADVADRASVERLFADARQKLGRIDILVNSAGVNVVKRSMADLAPADWDYLLGVNATGAYNCIRAALPEMRERKDGVIVNISSIAGKRAGLLGGVAYNASKFAMTALGMTVAQEEAKNNIRVSNVYPGEVDTPILENRPVPVTAEHRARILQPEDVAAAVLLLCRLPPRAHVPELVIKPLSQTYV
ncbi:MAG: SDR family oxidoreductase [Planctomycetia bacterium]|nr:SDR family oxidoreductase [Planctomycetia bacterium]